MVTLLSISRSYDSKPYFLSTKVINYFINSGNIADQIANPNIGKYRVSLTGKTACDNRLRAIKQQDLFSRI